MWRNGGGGGVFVPSPPLWEGEKMFWYVGGVVLFFNLCALDTCLKFFREKNSAFSSLVD